MNQTNRKRRIGLTTLIFFFIVVGATPGCLGNKGILQEEKGWESPGPEPILSQKSKEGETKIVQAPTQPPERQAPSPPAAPPPSSPAVSTPILVAPSTSAIPKPTPPPPASPQEPPKGSGFVFNFDNADLHEVIRVMAGVMKLNYIIDPKVRGVVNIQTSSQISSDDLFPVFQSILKLNGATAVKKGPLYEIVPFGEAKKLSIVPSKIDDTARSLVEEKYMIQIIPLQYIPVTEVSKMIKPFLSDGADIVEHPPQNILILGDIASNIRKSLDLIQLFDLDLFTDLRVRIYPVLYSDVSEIAKEMERIFASFEVSIKSARGVGITFTPITRINSLLVVSFIPNIFEKVEGWLKQLDKTPTDEAKLGVFVYYVQNSKAKDLADVLKQVFTPPKDKKEVKEKAPITPPTPSPLLRGVKPAPASPTPEARAAPAPEEGVGLPAGEINIVVDETTNALIIRAYPRDYKFILDTIKKLDLYPKQVLIELFLAEITLDDTTKFGLEWSTFIDSFTRHGTTYKWTLGMGGTAVDPAAFTTGIRYAIEATDKLSAAVHASAVDNRLKMISSPHLLASNNKEAKIQIGVAQPILTSTYTTTATASTNVVEGTIEYKDVGVIVSVTPRISDGGLVTMDLSIEDSKVDSTKLGTLDNVPVFKKKTANTTLSIMEGQSIVIGGLIEESGDAKRAGVPLLSKIPILGALFGHQEYSKKKTELILLLTPRVITDIQQSNAVTQEFKRKVETIRKEIEMKEQEKEKK
jgi:general secretion pathway protein D